MRLAVAGLCASMLMNAAHAAGIEGFWHGEAGSQSLEIEITSGTGGGVVSPGTGGVGPGGEGLTATGGLDPPPPPPARPATASRPSTPPPMTQPLMPPSLLQSPPPVLAGAASGAMPPASLPT